jgi:hypothetical protein
MQIDDWVVCRIFKKPGRVPRRSLAPGVEMLDSFINGLLDPPTLPPLEHYETPNYSHSVLAFDNQMAPSTSLNTSFSVPYEEPTQTSYVFHQEPIRRYCKAEQSTHQSIPSNSHETGLSELIDRNNEMLSVRTGQLDGTSELEQPAFEWDCIWNV